jgi:tRNA dimethylallyltransferase
MDGQNAFSWPDAAPPIVLVGPTASGKTAVSVELAERMDGEIINADSMQVYRGMDIGTAKPDSEARCRVAFHLLDIVSPEETFTVADWKERAEAALHDITRRGKRTIISGGTGLYIKALLEDWTLAQTPAHSDMRDALRRELAERGASALYVELKQVDPTAAARLHPNDGVRITRALEVYRTTGVPISVHQEQDKERRNRRRALRFGLNIPRPQLYDRINARVEIMLERGFVEEVRRLLDQGYARTLTSMRSLGYKEIISFLYGEQDYSATVAQIKQETRRYAKRQLTWFRADPDLHWLEVEALSSAEVACILRDQATRRP